MANQWEVMSEYCREQHPLLCEEVSEEDHYSPRFYRRIRPSSNRGRARNNLKGAAVIFSRWSDHWTSFLTYWWIGIGMISLTTFIIYNCLFAFSMLPSVNMKPASIILVHENEKPSNKSLLLPDIYMHVFLDQNEDIDLNQYLPYVELVANKFTEFKYNFIVLINDTNVGWMSAEENNELALNTLWTIDEKSLGKEYNPNINIEHVTLSTYMDRSPIKKYWRVLPSQLIQFVARTVAIWDKGGVAINPDILMPKFQHTLYMNKLQDILNKYAGTNKVIKESKVKSKQIKDIKKYKTMNNIRDIIEALEVNDVSTNAFSQQNLSEAENMDIQFIRHRRQEGAVTDSIVGDATVLNTEALNTMNHESNSYNVNNTLHYKYRTIVNSTESTYPKNNHNSTKNHKSLLPLFLEFLFHKKTDVVHKLKDETSTNRTRKRAILTLSSNKENSNNSSSKNVLGVMEKETYPVYSPLVVSATGIYNNSKTIIDVTDLRVKNATFEANRLFIDLKGNIVATDIPCHAFLGTIFSNVIHHSEEESITDFIIAELTIFCKGLLSSCMGIDLILL